MFGETATAMDFRLAELYILRDEHSCVAFHTPSLAVIGIPPGLGVLLDRLKAGASLPEALNLVAASGRPVADVLAAWSEFVRLIDGEAERPPVTDPPLPPLAPRAVWLHVSDRCNLSCRYCIDDRHPRTGDMSEQTVSAALDRFLELGPRQGALSINFFGGEPALRLPLIRHAVEHVRRRAFHDRRNVQFEMVTNGTLLDDSFADFLEEHRFRVTVSLDGPADLHDPLRPFSSGRGSHQAAAAGALRLLSRPAIQVKVRATIPRASMPLAPLLDYFLSLGFRDIEMLPVASPPDDPLALSGEHWKNYATELGELSLRWVDGLACDTRRFSLWPFTAYLPRIHARRPLGHCGAGRDAIAISSGGGIYPCPRYVYADSARPGSALSPVSAPDESRDSNSCRDCWARGYCPTPCELERATGEADGEFCLRQRDLVRLCLLCYARLGRSPALMARYLDNPAPEPQADSIQQPQTICQFPREELEDEAPFRHGRTPIRGAR
jgi:uncharacterized protein